MVEHRAKRSLYWLLAVPLTIIPLAASFDDIGREGTVQAFGKVPTVENSGGWLFHCHLLQHSACGMMSVLQAVYPD